MENLKTLKRAWLDQVLRDHEDLNRQLAEIRGFLSSPRPDIGMKGYHTWAAACAVRLVDIHDRLFRHFRYEESEGMLRDLAQVHPRALNQIDAMEKQHARMLEQLRGIIADVLLYSEGRPAENSHIRQRITEVLDQLAAHERGEVDLIQRMVYRDIGGVD